MKQAAHSNVMRTVSAPYRLIALLMAFSMPAGMVYAADESRVVKGWLLKMIKAERSVSYRGNFVYRHGDEMVAMQIVRAMGDNGMSEHLVSLNGDPGEVVRTPHRVKCLVPSLSRPVIYDNPQMEASTTEGLRARIDEIERYYRLSVGEATRVVGRAAQAVVITPRDQYRYGYQVWIDQQSGLLLKSEHLTADGKVLEQMIYSNIEIFGQKIPDEVQQLLAKTVAESVTAGDTAAKKQPMLRRASDSDNNNWAVKYIPNGFALANYQRRNDVRHSPFEHIVFSDGLASVSVFIEKQDGAGPYNGVSQRGAMNAYLATVDDYQVVVVGEVPLETLELIGESVRHSPVTIH